MDAINAAIERMLDEDVAVLDGWISASILVGLEARLSAFEQAGELAPAGIGRGETKAVHTEIRSDLTRWWTDPPTHASEVEYLAQIRLLSNQINRICFAGIRTEELLYASYPAGAFYRRHLDRFSSDSSRKISVITYLNRDWNADTDGGALVAYTPAGPVTVAPVWGRTVFFRSEVLEHEVLPAQRTRRSVTGWLR